MCRLIWQVARLKGIGLSVQMADVWSCGVTLYVMLVGAYPFEDQEDPKNFRKTIGVKSLLPLLLFDKSSIILLSIDKKRYIVYFSFSIANSYDTVQQRIVAVQYKIPDYVHISQDCRHLLSRIFVANPSRVKAIQLLFLIFPELRYLYIMTIDIK